MIQIKSKILGIVPYSVIWFADKPNKWKGWFRYYKQSSYNGEIRGYLKENFYTKVIDIKKAEKEIEASFDQNTIYEIRRAIKDGVETTSETDVNNFIGFYNLFASVKELKKLNSDFLRYQSCLIITKAVYQGKDLVMHAYLRDAVSKRIRLLHSASHFRNEKDNVLKAMAGRANRLLHYRDMCLFKQQGFELYDLGGYAFNTTDKSLLRINQFKDSFGGLLIKENDYLPLGVLVFSFFKKLAT